MIRQFVNIVVENYKSKAAMYSLSLHRLDVSKHLFYRSRDDAQVMPLVPEAQDATLAAGDEPPMIQRLEELPPPTTNWCSKFEFFGLLSPRNSDGRILCTNELGGTLLYDSDSNSITIMPSVNGFKGSVAVSASISRAGAEEEDLYIMHGAPEPCFSVLEYAPHPGSYLEIWQWESLPLPPFVYCPQYKPAIISSYTVMDGGRAICVSAAAEGSGGTYLFDAVGREWRRAGDWVLPFDGRAEYIPDLKLCLGFSRCRPHHLCATSSLSNLLMDQQPVIWQDHSHTPEEWMATSLSILSLGSGRFVIAKVFKDVRNAGESHFPDGGVVEDEFAVLTGMELRRNGDDDNDLQGLQMFKHKSVCYECASNTILSVL